LFGLNLEYFSKIIQEGFVTCIENRRKKIIKLLEMFEGEHSYYR